MPAADALNQDISSLITGSKDAKATALGKRRGLVNQILQRGVVPLAIGGEGYRERGPAGFAGGFVAGQALASPAAKMALARLLKAGVPEILARGLVSSGYLQQE